jgi:quercetin dioxygenase-like cupin family protein
MSDHPAAALRLVPPGDGRVIRAFGIELMFHLTGAQTGGKMTMATLLQRPGHGPAPHWHEAEDECFLIQEGRFQFLMDGEWREAGPGSVVFVPHGAVHTLRNVGETMGSVLVTAFPSGLETLFARCAEEFARPGGPDKARIAAIGAEHGLHFVES